MGNNSFPSDDSVIINPTSSGINSHKYLCSHCNTRLIARAEEDMRGGYFCVRCQITYWPQQTPVKKSNKWDLPVDVDVHGNITGDKTIPIVVIDDPNKEMSKTSYSNQKLPESYKALQKAGFKWITYEER